MGVVMRYLSIDIESTGLSEDTYLIEFAAVPIDSMDMTSQLDNAFHSLVKCPPFETLKSSLDPWVIAHNKELIENAAQNGLPINEFKERFAAYLQSKEIKKYFNNESIVLFGKSLNALDLPILNRDLGSSFIRKYFSHKVLDLTSVAYGLIDLGYLPPDHHSSSMLMQYCQMGEVAHTALEDAINTAAIYFKLLSKFKKTISVNSCR